MSTINNSINISAPVEKVFAYMSDPTNAPEWFVGMTEAKDVTGSGVGKHYHWKYSMIGIPLHGEGTITEHVPNERLVIETKGGVASTLTYKFTSNQGGTKVDVETEYTIPVPVLGRLAEKLVLKRNQRESEMGMANLKERLEG
jgi:uncharacterized protein YndB with AHSA1/START domain